MELLDSKFNVSRFLQQFQFSEGISGDLSQVLLNSAPEVSLGGIDTPRFAFPREMAIERRCLCLWRALATVRRLSRRNLANRAIAALRDRKDRLQLLQLAIGRSYAAALQRIGLEAIRTLAGAKERDLNRMRLCYYRWRAKWKERVRLSSFLLVRAKHCGSAAFGDLVAKYNALQQAEYRTRYAAAACLARRVLRVWRLRRKEPGLRRKSERLLLYNIYHALKAAHHQRQICARADLHRLERLKKAAFEGLAWAYYISIITRGRAISEAARALETLEAAQIASAHRRQRLLAQAFRAGAHTAKQHAGWLQAAVSCHNRALLRAAFAALQSALYLIEGRIRSFYKKLERKTETAAFRSLCNRYYYISCIQQNAAYISIEYGVERIIIQVAFAGLRDAYRGALLRSLAAIRWDTRRRKLWAVGLLLLRYKEALLRARNALVHYQAATCRLALCALKQAHIEAMRLDYLLARRHDCFLRLKAFETWMALRRHLISAETGCRSVSAAGLRRRTWIGVLEAELSVYSQQMTAERFIYARRCFLVLKHLRVAAKRSMYVRSFSQSMLCLKAWRVLANYVETEQKGVVLELQHTVALKRACMAGIRQAAVATLARELVKRKIFELWARAAVLIREVGREELERIITKKLRKFSD